MLWLVPAFGNYGAVVAMLTASILTVPLNVILLGRAIQFGAREIVDMIWCPLASSLAMSAVVLSVKLYWEIPSTLLRESRMLARYLGHRSLGLCYVRVLTQSSAGKSRFSGGLDLEAGYEYLNDVFGRIRVSYRQVLCAKELHK